MHKSLALPLALLLAASACDYRPSTPTAVQPAPTPIDLTIASEEVLKRHIGERVIVQGRFSRQGKISPLILVSGRPIYLKAKQPLSFVDRYSNLEGRYVRVTGTLRFFKSPEEPPRPVTTARPPDHFYFDEDAAKVELIDG